MKIIKVSTCEECPEYSHHEYDLPYCMKSERGIVYDDNPFPSWCPLSDAHEPVTSVLLKRAYSLGYDSGRAGNRSVGYCWDRDKGFFDCIPADGWISVEDRLPSLDGAWVLVYADGAVNCMGFDDRGFSDWNGNPISRNNVNIGMITHWMPLPDPPGRGK